MKKFKVVFGVLSGFVVCLIIFLFIIYGTIAPCGILKKEVAYNMNSNNDGVFMYALFGSVLERSINTLSPVECVMGIYKVKTKGVNKGLGEVINI